MVEHIVEGMPSFVGGQHAGQAESEVENAVLELL